MSEDRDEAVYRALLHILHWSDDEVRKVRPLAPYEFVRALEQDGWTVVPKPPPEETT